MNEESEQISVKPLEEFEIRLGAAPSTGYKWYVEKCPEQLQLLEVTYEQKPQDQLTVGGSVTQIFHFRGTNPGLYTVTFALKRQWETGVSKYNQIQVKIE